MGKLLFENRQLKPYPFYYFFRLTFSVGEMRKTVNEQLKKNESFFIKSFVIRWAHFGTYRWVGGPFVNSELPYDVYIEMEKLELNRKLQNAALPATLFAGVGDTGGQIQDINRNTFFSGKQVANEVYLDTPICKSGNLIFDVVRDKKDFGVILHEKVQVVDVIVKGFKIPSKMVLNERSAY